MDTSAASRGTGGTHSGGEPVVELVPAPLGFFALFGREWGGVAENLLACPSQGSP